MDTTNKPFEIEELDDVALEDVAGGGNTNCENRGCSGTEDTNCSNTGCTGVNQQL